MLVEDEPLNLAMIDFIEWLVARAYKPARSCYGEDTRDARDLVVEFLAHCPKHEARQNNLLSFACQLGHVAKQHVFDALASRKYVASHSESSAM